MAWKKIFTKSDAYNTLTAGILILLISPFIVSNYTPFIILNIIVICIPLIIISAGIILLWKTTKTTP
jgi:hypothetical protein